MGRSCIFSMTVILLLTAAAGVDAGNTCTCDTSSDNELSAIVAQHGATLLRLLEAQHGTKTPTDNTLSLRVSAHSATLQRLLQSQQKMENLLKALQKNLTALADSLSGQVTKGGDGSSRQSAGVTCNTILKYHLTGKAGIKSSVRWINPNQTDGGAFKIYCDFESFDGGWSLIYSSRDDRTGNNNMQRGDRSTAHITSLDPGNANKHLAYDVFQAIDDSAEGYSQVMLTGYKDYRSKNSLIKMYFNKSSPTGLNFTPFILGRKASATRSGCGLRVCFKLLITFLYTLTIVSFIKASYFGTELSSGKPIALSWEDDAFVAGAVPSGTCAWMKEIWNELNEEGGHLLAPQDWNSAEIYHKQTASKGALRNRGLFHIFIR